MQCKPHFEDSAAADGVLLCRGGFLFGCCTSTRLKVKEARGDEDAADTAADANVVDGGDVDKADDITQKQ